MLSVLFHKTANNRLLVRWLDSPYSARSAVDRAADARASELALAYAEVAHQVETHGDVSFRVSPLDGQYELVFPSDRETIEKRGRQSLDIIQEFQQKRKKYERVGFSKNINRKFTAYARNSILECGAVLSRILEQPQQCALVTLTVPSGTTRVQNTIARYSGYICNRLTQLLRRNFPNCYWMYVWERQKRGALHLHLAIADDGEEGASIRCGECLAHLWWVVLRQIEAECQAGIFEHRSGKFCWLPQYWQDDIQPCKKSVDRYLAKYASKTAGKDEGQGATRRKAILCSPKRWWGCCGALKERIRLRRLTVRLQGISRDAINSSRDTVFNFITRFNPVRVHVNEYEINFTRPDRDDFIDEHNVNPRAHICVEDWIVYFPDCTFGSLEVWLPTFIRLIASMHKGVAISGDIAKIGLTHPCNGRLANSHCIHANKTGIVGVVAAM